MLNINDTVKIKLNELGIAILKDRNHKLYPEESFSLPVKDKDGYYTFQVYEVLSIFGDNFNKFSNMALPFDETIKLNNSSMNINDNIKIKLNNIGLNMLKDRHKKLYPHTSFTLPLSDKKGYTNFELSEVIGLFGDSFNNSQYIPDTIPFDQNIKVR